LAVFALGLALIGTLAFAAKQPASTTLASKATALKSGSARLMTPPDTALLARLKGRATALSSVKALAAPPSAQLVSRIKAGLKAGASSNLAPPNRFKAVQSLGASPAELKQRARLRKAARKGL
jgi:hypothetical protein